MTAAEFEAGYARRSGVTVEWLRQYRTVLPCRCEADDCPGWQSVPHEFAADPFVRDQAGVPKVAPAFDAHATAGHSRGSTPDGGECGARSWFSRER